MSLEDRLNRARAALRDTEAAAAAVRADEARIAALLNPIYDLFGQLRERRMRFPAGLIPSRSRLTIQVPHSKAPTLQLCVVRTSHEDVFVRVSSEYFRVRSEPGRADDQVPDNYRFYCRLVTRLKTFATVENASEVLWTTDVAAAEDWVLTKLAAYESTEPEPPAEQTAEQRTVTQITSRLRRLSDRASHRPDGVGGGLSRILAYARANGLRRDLDDLDYEECEGLAAWFVSLGLDDDDVAEIARAGRILPRAVANLALEEQDDTPDDPSPAAPPEEPPPDQRIVRRTRAIDLGGSDASSDT